MNDQVFKPVSARNHIDNALRSITEVYKIQSLNSQTEILPATLSNSFIFLDGHYFNQRHLVLWLGNPIYFTTKSFKIFFILNLAAYIHHHDWDLALKSNMPGYDNLPWITAEMIEPTPNSSRYIYRMNKELSEQHIYQIIHSNDRTGSYRSIINPDCLLFNFKDLIAFPDSAVSGPADIMNRFLTTPPHPINHE